VSTSEAGAGGVLQSDDTVEGPQGARCSVRWRRRRRRRRGSFERRCLLTTDDADLVEISSVFNHFP
jgi:hypothetical protein